MLGAMISGVLRKVCVPPMLSVSGLPAEPSAGGSAEFVPFVPLEETPCGTEPLTLGAAWSVELLRTLRTEFERSTAQMPRPALTIDTANSNPTQSADAIHAILVQDSDTARSSAA